MGPQRSSKTHRMTPISRSDWRARSGLLSFPRFYSRTKGICSSGQAEKGLKLTGPWIQWSMLTGPLIQWGMPVVPWSEIHQSESHPKHWLADRSHLLCLDVDISGTGLWSRKLSSWQWFSCFNSLFSGITDCYSNHCLNDPHSWLM